MYKCRVQGNNPTHPWGLTRVEASELRHEKGPQYLLSVQPHFLAAVQKERKDSALYENAPLFLLLLYLSKGMYLEETCQHNVMF